MKINKAWSMPNRETFKIKPIKNLVNKYISINSVWIDPFVGNSVFKEYCKYTNDLNNQIKATHNLEALDFLNLIKMNSVDGILFDPPYSPRQIKECYKGIGKDVFQKDTQSSFYSEKKDAIAKLLKKGAIAICCGWNSQGIGKTRGFEMIEILLVSHGGNNNDTIVTVEKKLI